MNYFLNYTPTAGISINSFRKPETSFGELADLVRAVTKENENVSCSLEGAKDALEDGAYLEEIGVQDTLEEGTCLEKPPELTQEAVEEIHSEIATWEKNNGKNTGLQQTDY